MTRFVRFSTSSTEVGLNICVALLNIQGIERVNIGKN